MTPYQAIVGKRDLRVYTDQPIPDDVMHRILQAGRMAGSAKNMEANRLIVVTDQAVQDALAAAGDFASWIGSSAAIVGFAVPTEQLRLFDVGRQAQNMMVAAHAEGVGSCPVTLGHADVARAAVEDETGHLTALGNDGEGRIELPHLIGETAEGDARLRKLAFEAWKRAPHAELRADFAANRARAGGRCGDLI